MVERSGSADLDAGTRGAVGLILATADYAEGLARRPPTPLYLALTHNKFGGLPEAGGLLDQPAELLLSMSLCLDVYHAVQSFLARDKHQTAAWRRDNPYYSQLVDQIKEQRHDSAT